MKSCHLWQWMNLDNITVSKISETEKETNYKKKKKSQAHRYREQIVIAIGRDGGRGEQKG